MVEANYGQTSRKITTISSSSSYLKKNVTKKYKNHSHEKFLKKTKLPFFQKTEKEYFNQKKEPPTTYISNLIHGDYLSVTTTKPIFENYMTDTTIEPIFETDSFLTNVLTDSKNSYDSSEEDTDQVINV